MMTSLFVRSSFVAVVVFIITSQLNIIGVSGHGYLIEPPQRSSAWRAGFQTPVNYDDNGLNCGGFAKQWNENGGKCGVCGDAFDAPSPRPNEVGGEYGKGVIVRRYVAGQTVNMRTVLTATHKGYFEFKLCATAETPQSPTTQECLDRTVLKVENSDRTRYMLPDRGAGSYSVDVKLPDGLICEHCVLQWKYRGGNNWGTDPDGTSCLGCGPQEEFVNCADISISN